MNRQPSVNGPACALGLGGEDLSAWRDAQLPAEEMRRIGAHVPTCVACGRTLARFEAVAVALRRQRELEPGNRVWHGILTRATTRRGAGGGPGPNGNWRGIGALLAVAAVLALFVLLLGPGRFLRPVSPSPTKTVQISPTASPTIKGWNYTPVPQPTTPTFTPPSPNESLTTWAASAKVTTLNTQISSTQAFEAQGISPDGKMLLGALTTDSTNGQTDRAATFDLATRQVTAIPGMPSIIAGFGPPACCQDDGRFLVAVISSEPGATCGICNNVVWYYDTRAGGQAKRIPSNGESAMYLSQGLVAIEDDNAGIEVANLATGKLTQVVSGLSGSGSQTQGGGTIFAFSAPYLFYVPGAPTSQSPTIRVRDLATGQDVALSQINRLEPATANVTLVMEGTTLYATITATDAQSIPASVAAYTLPNFTPNDTAAPQQITLPNAQCGAPLQGLERVLSCYDTPSSTQYFYDRDQGEYLTVPTVNDDAFRTLGMPISGHYLLVATPANPNASQDAAAFAENLTIYDLSRVPTSAS